MIKLDEIDKTILNTIQLDFPLVTKPYEALGKQIGISEDDVISRIKRLHRDGAIRRIAPIINTAKAGGTSTLVAMQVPTERVDEVVKIINAYTEVSHNYLRTAKYNIWFTASAPSVEYLDNMLAEIERKTGCPLINLPTKNLFKIGVKFDIK